MRTSLGQTLVGDQHIQDLLRSSLGVLHGTSRGIAGFRPALFGEQPPPTEVNTLTPTRVMWMGIAETTPIWRGKELDLLLGSRELAIDPFPRLAQRLVTGEGEYRASIGLQLRGRAVPQIVTPAAEKYARSLGFYGSLVLAQEIVRETFPFLRALNVDLKKDPDTGGYPTICLAITTRESVDHVLELDDALQDRLYDRVPTDHRAYLSFTYHLE